MDFKRYLKFLPIVIIIIIIVVIIGRCSPRCPNPEDNISGSEGYRADCEGPDPTDLTATGDSNVIDLYVLYDGEEAFQEQIQAFQSQNPGLRVEVKSFTNLSDYENLIINELAEGEGPDVFMIHNSWMTKHLKKLTPMPVDLPVVMTSDIFRQTFFQASATDLIVDEQIYGMPLALDNLAVYYNKPQFNDLLASANAPALLWEDIQEQVFGLTIRDNSPQRFKLAGIAMGRSDNVTYAVDILYALMLQFGVQFYDANEQQATFADSDVFATDGINNPGAAALELYTSFALPSYKHYSWNQAITGFAPEEKDVGAFVRGDVSMILGYPQVYAQIQQSIQTAQQLGDEHIDTDDIGVVPFPQLVNPQESTSRDTYASYYPLVVARTSDNPRAAWSLIQFLTNAQSLQTYHNKTNRPTSRLDMVTEQQTDPLFGAFALQAPFAKSFKIYDDEAYRQIFSTAIDQVARNLATPKEALEEAQTKVTCVMQKEKGLIDVGTDCQI